MNNLTIGKILKDLENCNYEIATESRLVRVGLKDQQDIASILEKYKWLYGLSTVQFVKEKYQKETGPTKKEELRLLFFELASGFLYQKIAKLSDKTTTLLSQSKVTLDGEETNFYNLGPKMVKTPDFEKRERFQDAMFLVVEKVNPDYLLMLDEETAEIKKLGFSGHLDFYGQRKQVDYENFYKIVQDIYSKLKDLYLKKTSVWVEEILKRPWSNLRNCHGSYLLQINHFDGYFPSKKLVETLKKTILGMGLEPDKPNIYIDSDQRPKKNPRAACYDAKVPDEIHLIIKPVGGHYDYEAFFHEAGHAWHHAYTKASLSYSFRHLAPSNALTETFAFLFEYLTRNPIWLEKNLGLSKDVARRIAYEANLGNLLMLTRYLGKFSYEYQFFSAKEFEEGDKLYAQTLLKFTNFIYNPVMYLEDMDGGFYSADYLRAWLAEAQILNFLEKEFGETWFENKKVAEVFGEIWKDGFQFELEEQIVKNNISKPFNTKPLVEGFKNYLSGKI